MVDQSMFRKLPGVDKLLGHPLLTEADLPVGLIKRAAREAIDLAREGLTAGETVDLSLDGLAGRARQLAREADRPSLRRTVNATGVVVHTNLGRSLLAEPALKAIAELSRTYSNLEYDLAVGKRGSRYSHVVGLVKELTGAEAALVVNNNAAAVLVALNTLAQGKEVIVSRGQLVEIGGSFRIPEVMARSGAILREVGATNKTHLRDYEGAIGEETAGLLKVHQSNFAMVGFSQVVPLEDMVDLARSRGLWVMEDLGSGSLLDLSDYGLTKEPTAGEAVAEGADVVTFSGDKMLGGPQAGLIIGRKDVVARIAKNPINRAVRIDKMTLAALEATLRLYRDPSTVAEHIPTLAMMTAKPEQLKARARRLARKLKALKPGPGRDDHPAGFVSGRRRLPAVAATAHLPGWNPPDRLVGRPAGAGAPIGRTADHRSGRGRLVLVRPPDHGQGGRRLGCGRRVRVAAR